MYKITATITKIVILAAMLFTIAACDSNDGLFEKAGESIDESTSDIGNKMEDACEGAKEGVGAEDTRC